MNKHSILSQQPLKRRSALKWLGAGAGALLIGANTRKTRAREAGSSAEPGEYHIQRNNIRQSVAYWCFKPMPVAELAENAARMGLTSVELVVPEFWPELKKRGLICAITPSHGFAKGFAHAEEHEECLKMLRQRIDESADAGFPNVITFSGFRRGLTDEVATKNMVEGLKKIVGHAEKKKVTLCLEVLNSRVNKEMRGHPDYFCDRLETGVDICKQIGSERMKLLFDIYHIQIMEGDLISRIRQFHPYIAHYHTAGNPGRNELNDVQEINYPGVMKAILASGYQGHVGHEFVPLKDPVASLNHAVKLCDI